MPERTAPVCGPASLTRRMLLAAGAASAACAAAPPVLASAGREGQLTFVPGSIEDRVAAGLYGLAIGDGMGAPVEGWQSARVIAHFADHDFATFLPPTKPELIGTGRGKGDGRITDDGLLVEALIRTYAEKRDHLSAHDFARLFVREYAERPVWVPERQATMPAIERPLWHAELYSHRQLAIFAAEPRRAGMANRETQSYGGYVMPIGVVNAGDPDRAYREASDFGLATQSSYGLEAGAVTAASFAAALADGASPAEVISACLDLARDGTRAALHTVLPLVEPGMQMTTLLATVRQAYLPYSGTRADAINGENTDIQNPAHSSYGEPSRNLAIENPVVALAVLKWSRGAFIPAIRAAILYGQDCESIAAHVCGLVGALAGEAAIPQALRQGSDQANQRNRRADARLLVDIAREIWRKDAARADQRKAALLAP